ncbi:MAG TPA: DUF1611 domain-containing protein [Thermoanaerobaculia bacterium]|nr:DUF1611 domain-containing protein [Thermoanaerobaculia bacterium]
MDGTAIVLCEGYFQTPNGKTAHGLVRGSNRYRILGIVDPPTSGKDAGEVLDGKARGISVYASIAEALERCPTRPDYAIVGVATAGGRFTPVLRASLSEAIEQGLSIVNGLHEFASEDGQLAAAARQKGVRILDVRKARPTSELRFWTGEIRNVSTPRVAVLGTDCAIGKRTTLRLVAEACNRGDLRTEWISTGQTGWMQGAPFGILLDSLPNDFVSGELEHAIVSCARELAPDLILIEGQSSLRNPSGPCGSELILSAGARGVILQHAPGRLHFEGFEGEENRIPPVAEEIELIRLLGARTLALTLNGEGLAREQLELEREKLQGELQIPVALPLEEGVESLVPVLRSFIRSGKTP